MKSWETGLLQLVKWKSVTGNKRGSKKAGNTEETGETRKEKKRVDLSFPALFLSAQLEGHQDTCVAGLKGEASHCSQLSRLILLTPEPLPVVSRASAEGIEGM